MLQHSNHRVPEEEDKKKDHEKILEEIIAENFPNVGKEIVNQVQEAQRVPGGIIPRRNSPRHLVIKMMTIKGKILKATREKQQITYKGTPIMLSADFSTETLLARREEHDIKVMKGKNVQPKLYPARFSFRFDGEIKSFQTSKS